MSIYGSHFVHPDVQLIKATLFPFILVVLNKITKIATCLLLWLQFGPCVVAQENQFYTFHRLYREDNLTNSIINAIETDQLGFVWVGTEDGLFRYDGLKFESYRRDHSRYSLPNNVINDIYCTSENQVWIATNFGVARFSYALDSIKIYLPQQMGFLNPAFRYTSITQDEDGKIYLGTDGRGVITFEEGRGFGTLVAANNAVDLNEQEISALEYYNEKIYIGTWRNGLFVYDTKNQRVESLGDSGLEQINALNISDSTILVGTIDGLHILNNRGLTLFSAVVDDEVLSIAAHSEHYWIGTRNSGLYKMNHAFKLIDNYSPSPDINSVSHRTISQIEPDKYGNIWLGTHNDGINVLNPRGEGIVNLKPNSHNVDASKIWAMSLKDESSLWIGTDGAGLFTYNLVFNQFRKFAGSDTKIELSDNAILSILQTENRLLIGTYSGGLNSIDLRSLKNTVYHSDNSELLSNDIRCLYEDTEGTIWVGTNRGGLYRFDSPALSRIDILQGADVREIVEDNSNLDLLWVITHGDGLIRFNKKDQSINYYNWNDNHHGLQPIGLTLTQIENEIWIGTKQSGLVIFDKSTENFEVIDESRGLINNTVRAMVFDGTGVWIGSNHGISRMNLQSREIKNFEFTIDQTRYQVNDGSAMMDLNGNVYFGSIKGLNVIDPDRLFRNEAIPEVYISQLEVNGKLVNPGNELARIGQNIAIAKKVELEHSADVINIRFNLPAFGTNKFQFAYRLNGYDDWNITQSNTAMYRNVSHGSYEFQVKAIDQQLGSEGPVKSVAFVIHPPWWLTPYAIIIYVIVVILLIYFIYRYNLDRISMQESLKYEQKVRQQEHDSMLDKIKFYTNFSHEMKTPITLIMGPLNDMLRSDQLSDLHKMSLKMIKRNANTLLRLINRLLEFRKIETESTALNIGYHDITILAQEEAEGFTYLAREHNIKFAFYSESEIYGWVDLEKVQIVMNNLLSNALKYSKAGDKVTLRILQDDEQNVIIEVQDQGRGIKKEEHQKIFLPFYQAENSIGTGGTGIGLALCKSFVELHNGTISVESEIEHGSLFRVKLNAQKSFYIDKPNVRIIERPEKPSRNHIEIEELENEDHVVEENENILLIADDNRDIREYIVSIFTEHFKVLTAKNGKEALDIAQETAPDIIISDIMMPEMDGIAFCNAIKSTLSTSHIPVILLTAKNNSSTKIEGYETGADDYISKPFDSKVLFSRVNNLVQSRKHLREIYENGNWLDDKKVPTIELEFISKVETVVLEMIPDGQLNVVNLCKELGFSRTSLYRKIKSLTGQSIKQFIRSIKLKRAAEMLATENMMVSEVAFSLDFTDLKYFRSCFKKQFGILPSEYQNKLKSNAEIDQEEIRKAFKIG